MTTTVDSRRQLLDALWAEAWRLALLAAVIVIAVLADRLAVVAVTFPFVAITGYHRPLRERAAPFTVSLAGAVVAIYAFVPGHVHELQAISALLITALLALACGYREQ